MLFRLLADMVLVIHLAFVLFAVLGGLLVLKWRWVMWLHIPAVIWGVAIEVFLWVCPLTYLENALRVAGGRADYGSGFIERYLLPILYPRDLTPETHAALGAVLLGLNLLIYGVIAWRGVTARTR